MCVVIIILLLLLVHSRIDHHQEEEVVDIEVIDAEVEIQNDTLERIAGTQHGND